MDNYINWSWYHLVKGEEGRKINVRGLPHCYGTDTYVESFIHLDLGASNEENHRIKENMVVEEEKGKSNEGNPAQYFIL